MDIDFQRFNISWGEDATPLARHLVGDDLIILIKQCVEQAASTAYKGDEAIENQRRTAEVLIEGVAMRVALAMSDS